MMPRAFHLVLLFLCCQAVWAQEPVSGNPLPARLLDNHAYASTLPLASALGLGLAWDRDGRGARLSAGDRWLQVGAETILARGQAGRVVLPLAPIVSNGSLLVPAEAVVNYFGGTARRADQRLDLSLGDQQAWVDLRPVSVPTDARQALVDALNDPRVPLARLHSVGAPLTAVRRSLNQFNALVGPIRPLLTALGSSRTLVLLKHLPVVGGFLANIESTIKLVGDGLAAANELAAIDDRTMQPVRAAIAAAVEAAQSDDPLAAAQRLAPTWQAALPALDQQATSYSTGALGLVGLNLALGGLDQKARQLNADTLGGKLTIPAWLPAANRATDEVRYQLQDARWGATVQKAYFQRLLALAADAR